MAFWRKVELQDNHHYSVNSGYGQGRGAISKQEFLGNWWKNGSVFDDCIQDNFYGRVDNKHFGQQTIEVAYETS